MNNKNAINKKVLLDHFAGRSTPLEKALIEEWLSKPENMEYYYECLDMWENHNPQFIAAEIAAFKKISHDKTAGMVVLSKKAEVLRIGRWISIAAAVMVVIGFAIFIEKDNILDKTESTAYGEVKEVVLPDGSTVTLNSNSEIKYARFGFAEDTREIRLDGEADFSVIHTKSNQKFVVTTNNNLNVTVLGTQFSIYNRNMKSEVVLRKGKVELNYATNTSKNKTLILKPGDAFIKNEKGTDEVHYLSNTEQLVAWKNHDFLFEGTSLIDVASTLKDNFGVKIIFQSNTLATRKISGSFHAENADELIDAIAQLLDVNYSKKKNVIYFFE